MAEHIRNQLARAGAMVRPSRITTLAQFIDLRSGDLRNGDSRTALRPASQPVLHLLIERALSRVIEKAHSSGRWTHFARVADFPGFHHALAALMEEVPADSLGGSFGEDLKCLFEEVEADLARRGMALRNARLKASREGPWPAHAVFDGFFTLSTAELDFVERIAAVSPVTFTLPNWPGAQGARQRLLSAGFAEHRCTGVFRSPERITFSAPTLDREIEEIARRILTHAARGREFREMGVVLRTRDPYGPALETTFARFGIPARFYFADSLSAHPAVAYLSGWVRAVLSGWEHASLLALLRMPVSGIGATPAGDRLDFELRTRLPGAGLPLHGIQDVPQVVRSLGLIDSAWLRERLSPLEWAARLKTLRSLLPEPVLADDASYDQVRRWRSTAAALDAFDSALDQTAVALAGEGRMTLAAFWRHADAALALEPLRIADRRRNVVHILDVFEARQWELPIVFVCGLTERHFPQYHREDPLLNDEARRRAGLDTSSDRQAQERFLFELAATRPTEELVLSYPRFNDRGEPALPSFFLDGAKAEACETRVRPRNTLIFSAPVSSASVPPASSVRISDLPLLERLAQAHKKLAPTSIESFLQCPFQFFAGKTLRLRRRPPAPRDRLDVLVQGSILHRALAELTLFPLLGAEVFEQVFADECHRVRVPSTYRTEAVRLELRGNFTAFVADRQVQLGWASRVEEKFVLQLNPALAISGRIDRLDVGPRNQALVIDYKYSAGDRIRERVEDTDSGDLVQAGLYLLAAVRAFGLDPVGMLYCGLRKEVNWDGWHTPVTGLEAIGESMTPSALQDFMNAAAAKAEETFAAIASGRVAPQPANPRKCVWCDFRDICRIETAAAARTASAP